MSDLHRNVFNSFDKDNSGDISITEIQAALGACGRQVTEEQVHQLITDAGLTDKSIDYDAFLNLIGLSDSEYLSMEDVQQLFHAIDLDCAGYLTVAEIRHFMTNLNLAADDAVVDQMMALYDDKGDNQITIDEFGQILIRMGYEIEDGVLEILKRPKTKVKQESVSDTNDAPAKEEEVRVKISDFPKQTQEIMSLFDYESTNQVLLSDLKRASELFNIEKMSSSQNCEANPALHWTVGRPKRGLADLVYKANHIALIVSDVGRSAAFYSDVMGFQQIRRPNFDKQGAWFTIGNIELHLIKGTPIVHDGEDLIVGHISIETFEIEKVPAILRELKVPFRQNVSVPKSSDAGKGTNTGNKNKSIVVQYFIRDPDGYYLEICNCDVLTSYCLGEKSELAGYEENVTPLKAANAMKVITLMHQWKDQAAKAKMDREKMIEAAKETDGSVESLAKLFGAVSTEEVDKEKLENLKIRRTVYGDICQNETETRLERILKACGNDMSIANDLMKLRADVEGQRIVMPPAFYEDGKELVKPGQNVMTDNL